MRRNSIFTLAALIIASLLQAVAQNNNQTPGSVAGWGSIVMPRAEPGTRFSANAAGGFHSLALKSDGTVVVWGLNDYGQSTVPAGLNGAVAIAAGGFHSLALTSDGTAMAWGANDYGQRTVPAGLNGVVAIAAGDEHSLALVREQPRLEISAGENAVVLSWPVTADGYVVESARALATPEWETATNTPAILADRYVLTNSWSSESRFFRLRPR